MSNLSSTVLFDVVRGWPDGAAVEECFPPTSGSTVLEGELVVLAADGTVDVPASIATEGGTTRTRLYLVIQGNDQSDANYVGKVVCLRGNLTIETEKFVGAIGNYTVGELVTVDVAGADAGQITERTGANEQIVGMVEAVNSTAGKITVALSL